MVMKQFIVETEQQHLTRAIPRAIFILNGFLAFHLLIKSFYVMFPVLPNQSRGQQTWEAMKNLIVAMIFFSMNYGKCSRFMSIIVIIRNLLSQKF